VGRANDFSLDSPSPHVKGSVPARFPANGPRIMKLQFYIADLFATGYLALTPFQAAGAPAGHMSAALSHGNERYRYSAPYLGSSYTGYAGIYDSDYSYTPTPEQNHREATSRGLPRCS
jgi:hypothetical protein